jgi:hypothetical protein
LGKLNLVSDSAPESTVRMASADPAMCFMVRLILARAAQARYQ